MPVQAGRWLVQQKHLRLHSQGVGQRHPLFLPAGKILRRTAPVFLQRKTADGRIHAGAYLAYGQAQVHRAEADLLLHAAAQQLHLRVLEHKPHAPAQHVQLLCAAAHWRAPKQDASRTGAQHAVRQKEKRGLSRAVAAQHRHALAGAHLHAHVQKRLPLFLVCIGNMFKPKDLFHFPSCQPFYKTAVSCAAHKRQHHARRQCAAHKRVRRAHGLFPRQKTDAAVIAAALHRVKARLRPPEAVRQQPAVYPARRAQAAHRPA